jgi:hypothetical protein
MERKQDTMEHQRSIFGPLLLISAGVLWLLMKSGAIPGENLWALTHIWPYLLIAAGLGLILRNYWKYASIFVDVLIIGGVLLAIWFAPRLGWTDPSLVGVFWNNGMYFGPGESGSGKVITETRDVSGFDSIQVEFPVQIFISQGQAESVKVKAEDNFLPGLKTEVHNGALEIFYKVAEGDRVNPTEPVVITIVVKDLTDVEFSSAGELTIEGVQADKLDISLSGAGNIKMTDLDVEDLSVVLSGAGNMSASGSAANLNVEINGFGSFSGGDLHAITADVVLSGAGSATVWVDERLDAEISGAGSVNYYGDAAVAKQIGGLGGVKHLGDK